MFWSNLFWAILAPEKKIYIHGDALNLEFSKQTLQFGLHRKCCIEYRQHIFTVISYQWHSYRSSWNKQGSKRTNLSTDLLAKVPFLHCLMAMCLYHTKSWQYCLHTDLGKTPLVLPQSLNSSQSVCLDITAPDSVGWNDRTA